MTRGKRSFGYIRLLPSKRYQASYIGPDSQRHAAPETFTAKMDAEGWLSAERRLIEWDQWTSPEQRAAQRRLDATQTLKVYVEDWLPQRVAVRQLAPVCLRSWKRRSGRPAASRALRKWAEWNVGARYWPPRVVGKSRPSLPH